MNRTCNKCNTDLPKSCKPNKSGLCNKCYRIFNTRRWETNNKEHFLVCRKEYVRKNRKRYSDNKVLRYKNDLDFRIKEKLRTRLSRAVSRNRETPSAVRDLGCSIRELKLYLENRFIEGMSWDNYGKWHIDHIVPLNSFDLKNPEELKKAIHYSNLQPLWESDNKRKSDK